MAKGRKGGMNPQTTLKHLENVEKFVKNSVVTSQNQIVKEVGCTTLVITALASMNVVDRVQPKDPNLRKSYVWNNKHKPNLQLAKKVITWLVDYNNRREERHLKLVGKRRQRVKGIPSPKQEWIKNELPTVVVRIMKGVDFSKLSKKSDKELLDKVASYINNEVLN